MEAASTKPEAAAAGRHRAEPQPDIALGVIVAPGLARDVTAKVASELADDLRAAGRTPFLLSSSDVGRFCDVQPR